MAYLNPNAIFAPEARFDPDAHLPHRLQARLDSWDIHPPFSQFQAYGPLTAYLQGHKFTSNRFIVKPQAYLREEKGETDSEMGELEVDLYALRTIGHRYLRSVDSQGASVTNYERYPDFTVCQYWGDPYQEGTTQDIIRIVLEVGTRLDTNSKATIMRQVKDGLDLVGGRWKDRILGIGIIQSHVFMMRNTDENGEFAPLWNGQWISMYDYMFVKELNRLLEYCTDMDPL